MGRRRRNGAAAGRAAGVQRLAARAAHATASTRGGNHWREAMTLVLLLLIPPGAGLLCLATHSRARWERLNLAAFALVAGLALLVAGNVASQGTISALDGFLRADALSALGLGFTGVVSRGACLGGGWGGRGRPGWWSWVGAVRRTQLRGWGGGGISYLERGGLLLGGCVVPFLAPPVVVV